MTPSRHESADRLYEAAAGQQNTERLRFEKKKAEAAAQAEEARQQKANAGRSKPKPKQEGTRSKLESWALQDTLRSRIVPFLQAPQRSLTFNDIPWPVLHSPASLDQQVFEASVHEFFRKASINKEGDMVKYRRFMKDCHFWFYPDKWIHRLEITESGERSNINAALKIVARVVGAFRES